ncbi:MAG TPA: hypothetical protein VGO67_11345 [Verrucomicrobiae bacterium]|jgi:hypothetical protein
MIKRIRCALALAGCALLPNVHAITTNNIQLWAGSGTNRAALVIEWNSPEFFNNSTVPAPVANKTMVWGYKFNGEATGAEMFKAILASDHRLYAVVVDTYGTYVEGIGYNLNGTGNFGVTDGSQSYTAAAFKNGILLDPALNIDSSSPVNNGDLYWGGYYGPNWNSWTELNDAGGLPASPDRGTNQFWDGNAYVHGQWEFAEFGLDTLPIKDGSWLGFSVSAAGYDTNTADAATAAYNNDEQAPPSPDGTYVAYVADTNDFAVQVVSSSNVLAMPPYDNPNAVLGRPSLTFFDVAAGGDTNRCSIIDPPYNVGPGRNDLITEITNGGQITVKMGRKVYHNANNPYGMDLIVYGNSFFSPFGSTGTVSDSTDLDDITLGSGTNGHSATVSVSPDGTNWYSFDNTAKLYPQNAYRWDSPNHSWKLEQSNPTKPLDPAIYSTDFEGQTAFSALDHYDGSAGGTGYNLQASGFPWIQYVRIEPAPGSSTVIDSIAAVNPAVEGDTLTITSDDIDAGITNLAFQSPGDSTLTAVELNVQSVVTNAVVSAVPLGGFSAFAPVPGTVLNACQLSATPISDIGNTTIVADVGLSVGRNYVGAGGDLRVLQWSWTNWNTIPFTLAATNNEAWISSATNLSALVVTRMTPPVLSAQPNASGPSFQFTPFANVSYTLQRSTDLLTWTPVTTVTPVSVGNLILQDPSPPANQAFYRLLVIQ